MGRQPFLRLPQFTIRFKNSANSSTSSKEEMEPTTIIPSTSTCPGIGSVGEPYGDTFMEECPNGCDRSTESSSFLSSCASSLMTEGEEEDLEDLDLKCPIQEELLVDGPIDGPLDCEDTDASHPKHVRFGSAQFRVYPQVLGDHPYCAEGCSLELDWEFTLQEECPAEAGGNYQKLCPRLTPEERLAIVQTKYSDQCIRQACRRRQAQDGIVGKRQQRRLQQEFFGLACK
jgi:hypothetical protein